MAGNITDFLRRVLPWPADGEPGFCNLHWTTDKSPGMRGRPYTKVEDFLGMAHWLALKPSVAKEIYFCLSSQRATGKVYQGHATALRNQRNVHRLKALWIDVDVKPEKGYAAVQDAINAITDFVGKAKLPPPSAIVLSGGGVHVYWISQSPITKEEWQPYADGLELLTRTHGLKCDRGITTDSARVLRVPGTFNRKTAPPRPVRLAALGIDYNFSCLDFIRGSVAPVVTGPVTKPVFDLSKFPARPIPTGGIESLAEGLSLHDATPLDYAGLFKGCPHFQDAYKTHGANYEQGLWMLDVLACTFLEDGPALSHVLSRGYTSYTPEETEGLFSRKKADRENGIGWPSCKAFENAGCLSCATCPLRGSIRSPLNLCTPKIIPKLATMPAVTVSPPDMYLPNGYLVDAETGYICELVQKQIGSGATQDEYAQLFECRLTLPWMQNGPAAFNITTSLDLEREQRVSIPETELATDTKLMVALRSRRIKPYVKNERRVRAFMSSWTEKLDAAKARINTVPYGWIYEGGEQVGFAYGGHVYRKDGQDHMAGYADERLQQHYTPSGTMDNWRKAIKIITYQKRPDLEAIIALSFGSPLMHVPAQYNGMLHAMSSRSGAHKSTAISIGSAVWGNPKMTKDTPTASPLALMKKLGELRNLPAYWDEISDKKRIENVRHILGSLTEGVEGNKLHSDRSFRESGNWQAMICVGSNLSLWDEITKHVKNTDAQLRRVFQIEVEKMPDTQRASDVEHLIKSLDYNFGWAGKIYAEWLGRNPELVERDTRAILNDFEDQIKVASEERFWTAVCATTIAGAAFANKLGLANFNLGEMYGYLLRQFSMQREHIKGNSTVASTDIHVSDVLTLVMKSLVENMIWTQGRHLGRGKPVVTVLKTLPRPGAVHVEWDITHRRVRISKTKFEEILDATSYEKTAVFNGLKKHFLAEIGVKRVDLTAGTTLSGGQETIIQIPIPPGSELEGQLFAHTPPEDRPGAQVLKPDVVGLGQSQESPNAPTSQEVSKA